MADDRTNKPQPLSQAVFYGARAPVAAAPAPRPAPKKRARECALARWSSCRTQDEALARAREGGGELRVWAHELSKTGVRSYIVASARDFWAVYRTLPDIERRHYELIAPDRPCRLYFDLEFAKAPRAALDDAACARAMAAFWTLLRRRLEETLGVVVDSARTVELDSTSASKFSRHVTASLRRSRAAATPVVGRGDGGGDDGPRAAGAAHGGAAPAGEGEGARGGAEPPLSTVRADEAAAAAAAGAVTEAAAAAGTEAAAEADADADADADAEVLFASNAHVGAWVRRWVEELHDARTTDPLAALLFATDDEPEATHATHADADADAAAPAARPTEQLAAMAPPPEASGAEPGACLVDSWVAQAGAQCLGDTRVSGVPLACSLGAPRPPVACLLDSSVYSRHRCFRLYRSAKVGKQVPLLPVGLSLDQTRALPLAREAALFGGALVVPAAAARAADVLATDLETHARQGAGALAGGGGGARAGAVCRPIAELLPPGACDALGALRAFGARAWAAKSGRPCDVRAPQLVRPEGGAAGERAGGARLLLAVVGNRWCGRVGREHRSNGVYLCARVRAPDATAPGAARARASGSLSQRCHDPDCRQFRGDELPLPPELADALYAALEGAPAPV